MVQWINVLQNNSFVNPTQLPLLCRNFRTIALAEPDLTAGWLAGWLADEILVNFEFLKFNLDGCCKCENWGSHRFPCRSLLLSTTVLNDTL